MPDAERIRYLAELDASLPMPLERRAEILEEINAHLDDAVAGRVQLGDPPDVAEAQAQARLGPPRNLAADLARPEQSAWRLVAAAGASVRVGIGQWIYGFLLGSLILLLGLYLLSAVVWATGELLNTPWSLGFTDQGWNTMLSAGTFALGLFFAGRAMPRTASTVSRRPYAQVRPWVAAFGTVAAFGVLVLLVDMQHNAASVIAMTVAPIGFALGIYRPDLLPNRLGVPWFVIGGLLFLIPLGLVGGVSGGDGREISHESEEERLAVAGPRWTDPTMNDLSYGGGGWTGDGRAVTSTWAIEPASIPGLRDLRIEAWRGDSDFVGRLDARWNEPFAIGPIERSGARLTGTIITTDEPGVSFWRLLLTGVGPNGTRYVIADGGGGNSTFTGSVWDWISAVARDR